MGNFSKRDGRREREQDFAELFSENWLSDPELRYRGFLSLMFPVVNVLFIMSISALFYLCPDDNCSRIFHPSFFAQQQ